MLVVLLFDFLRLFVIDSLWFDKSRVRSVVVVMSLLNLIGRYLVVAVVFDVVVFCGLEVKGNVSTSDHISVDVKKNFP